MCDDYYMDKVIKNHLFTQPLSVEITMKEAPQLKAAESTKIKSFNTKSAQIRYLNDRGYSNGDISRTLTKFHGKLVRPQHVSNVLRTPVTTPTEK